MVAGGEKRERGAPYRLRASPRNAGSIDRRSGEELLATNNADMEKNIRSSTKTIGSVLSVSSQKKVKEKSGCRGIKRR